MSDTNQTVDPKVKAASAPAPAPTVDQKATSTTAIGSPMNLEPQNLPRVLTPSKDASTAQVEYAKIINGYAYSNPDKFEHKKEQFIRQYDFLKKFEIPDTVKADLKLELKNKAVSVDACVFKFRFLRAPDGPMRGELIDVAITLN